jgi:hypothetical protein
MGVLTRSFIVFLYIISVPIIFLEFFFYSFRWVLIDIPFPPVPFIIKIIEDIKVDYNSEI